MEPWGAYFARFPHLSRRLQQINLFRLVHKSVRSYLLSWYDFCLQILGYKVHSDQSFLLWAVACLDCSLESVVRDFSRLFQRYSTLSTPIVFNRQERSSSDRGLSSLRCLLLHQRCKDVAFISNHLRAEKETMATSECRPVHLISLKKIADLLIVSLLDWEVCL